MNTPQILHGNNLDLLRTLPDCSVDSIVTDPPYELGFMGKKWDSTGIAYSVELWSECLRVLKHGGHLLAFSGSRTYHRMVVAIEDAGFEIRDQIMWVYGSGFPKSLDVSKAIDKQAGAERQVIGFTRGVGVSPEDNLHGGINRGAVGVKQVGINVPITTPATDGAQQWSGWGTALKPAHEPIVMARKPLGEKTVAENVLRHGTGAINIEASRIASTDGFEKAWDKPISTNISAKGGKYISEGAQHTVDISANKPSGRFPANFIHDGSDEVLALFPDSKGMSTQKSSANIQIYGGNSFNESSTVFPEIRVGFDDSGSAARFFYCAKAGKAERNAGLEALQDNLGGSLAGGNDTRKGDRPQMQPTKNFHPTVKPVALMRYLVRMVTPPEGTVLDPFTGSGTTLVAAVLEGFNSIGMEMTADYLPIIEGRVAWALAQEPEQPTLF